MEHHTNVIDAAISVGAFVVAAVTSNQTLIFLSIVLVVIRIYRSLKEKP